MLLDIDTVMYWMGVVTAQEKMQLLEEWILQCQAGKKNSISVKCVRANTVHTKKLDCLVLTAVSFGAFHGLAL